MSLPCVSWRSVSEGAVFHAACLLLSISLSAGSSEPGPYWRIYISVTSLLAFTGWALWAWLGLCSVDALCWSLILAMACVSRATLDVWRLRETRFPGPPEVRSWFDATFHPLCVSRANFLRLVQQALKPEADGSPASESRVEGHGEGHSEGHGEGHGKGHGGGHGKDHSGGHSGGHGLLRLQAGEFYTKQGETPIDRLAVLLDGRMSVSMDSVTLHSVAPFQFLDSVEWESGGGEPLFLVSVMAVESSLLLVWPRASLVSLLSRDAAMSRLVSLLLGRDISDKIYALNRLALPATTTTTNTTTDGVVDDSVGGDHVMGRAATDIRLVCLQMSSLAAPECLDFHPSPPTHNAPQQLLPPPPLASHNALQQHKATQKRPVSQVSSELSCDSTSLMREDFTDAVGSLLDYGSRINDSWLQ